MEPKQRTPLAIWAFERRLSVIKSAKMFQEKAGRRVDHRSVRNWMDGHSRPRDIAIIEAIRNVTGLSTDEILGIPAQEGQS